MRLTLARLLLQLATELFHLRSELLLHTVERADLTLGILQLTGEVAVFGVQLGLCRLEVLDLTALFVGLELEFGQLEFELLRQTLGVAPILRFRIEIRVELFDLSLHERLIFFDPKTLARR